MLRPKFRFVRDRYDTKLIFTLQRPNRTNKVYAQIVRRAHRLPDGLEVFGLKFEISVFKR